MSTDMFNRRLREFAIARLSEPGQHTRAEIVRAFIDANPELVEIKSADLAARAVDGILKKMGNENPDAVQSPLFDGFPAIVNLGNGQVKALQHCTHDDIRLGEEHRQENVRRAQDSLREYRRCADNFLRLMAHNDETFGEMQERLAREANGEAA